MGSAKTKSQGKSIESTFVVVPGSRELRHRWLGTMVLDSHETARFTSISDEEIHFLKGKGIESEPNEKEFYFLDEGGHQSSREEEFQSEQSHVELRLLQLKNKNNDVVGTGSR